MCAKETYLQSDLFTGALVDTRSARQKKEAALSELPRQAEMFSQRDIAQFGVQAHPQIPLAPQTRLQLIIQDVRTAEEKERDLQREIQEHSYRLPGLNGAEAGRF